jgi:histidinol-phosphate aminotransferase
MKKLIKENVLKVEQYEPGKPIEILRRELGFAGVICKLASNENPLGPSPYALEAIKKSLNESNFYPDNSCYLLREKLGEHLGFDPKYIRVGNGTTELIYLIGVAFLNPEDKLIMSESGFIMAKIMAQIVNCHLTEVPLNGFSHNLGRILEEIDEETKVVYLDIPMNPVGTSVIREQFSSFMERIPEDVLVVCDEAYYEYANKASFPQTLKFVEEGRNLMVLRTFSKLYGLAGFRVGYCVAQENLLEALWKVSPPFSVNRFAQIGAAAALVDHQHVRKTLEMNELGKRFLYENLNKMSVNYIPSETNFVTIDARIDAREICEKMQKKGIIVRPLAMYGKPNLFRVTIGTPEQNQKFIEAFQLIYQTHGQTD